MPWADPLPSLSIMSPSLVDPEVHHKEERWGKQLFLNFSVWFPSEPKLSASRSCLASRPNGVSVAWDSHVLNRMASVYSLLRVRVLWSSLGLTCHDLDGKLQEVMFSLGIVLILKGKGS